MVVGVVVVVVVVGVVVVVVSSCWNFCKFTMLTLLCRNEGCERDKN